MRLNIFLLPLQTNVLFTLVTITLVASSILLILDAIFMHYSLLLTNPPKEFAEIRFNLHLLSILIVITLPLLFLVFLISPWRKFQSETYFPEIIEILEYFKKEMNIKKEVLPIFVKSEQVFAKISGVLHHKLVISTSLCKRFNLFPDVVKAILAHELAHVKNGDVAKHEIAEAAWKSYIGVTIIYLLISLQLKHSYVYVAKVWGHLLFPSISLYILNAYIRRLREFYADARVSDRKSLTLAFRLLLLPRARKLWEFLIRIYSVPISDRLIYLQNTDLLLKPKAGFGFVLGMVSWLILFNFLIPERILVFMEVTGFSKELASFAFSALLYTSTIIVILTNSLLILYILISYNLVLMFSKAVLLKERLNILK